VSEKKQDLVGIVGVDHVLDDPLSLEGYGKDQSFVLPMRPRLVVRPGTEDEVQNVIAWANQTATPLVPVSSGAPHFYGDTVPSVPGAVMVDLSRMNRIMRIDRRNRMAVVEPGVTYSQLQPELAKAGLRLTPPLYPRANKSVVASLLERQPTLIPRYNHSLPEPLRDCGVVWGNGEKMYTGEAGYGPHALEKQWEAGVRLVDPKGPAQTDFFRLLTGAQGSMGIVTWASVRCQILPAVHKLFFVAARRLDDLIGISYRLQRLRLGDEVLLVNDSLLAGLLGAGAQVEAMREELPPWTLIVGVGGRALLPEEKVDVQEKDIREVAGQFSLELLSAVPGATTGQVRAVLDGCCGEPHWKLGYKGGCQDIFFLTTLDKTRGFVATMLATAEEAKYPLADVGVYIQPQHQGVAYHCEFTLPFAPDDAREVARATALYERASERLIGQGAYFSRPYGAWAGPVYNRDAQSTTLLRNVKGVFDPNNVMNPGKLCF
jgi:FAD/FMN-containing dehydrogenase